MIIVEGFVRLADAGDVETIRAAAEAQLEASRAEAGCLDYTYAIDFLDPSVIRVLERWESWEALETHFRQPHMGPWRDALKSVGILERRIMAHETGESRSV